jgi:hypothetical protein
MDGIIFAYFGPETMFPLTSIVAACAGAVMMFGRGLMRFARRSSRARATAQGGAKSIYRPHVRVMARAHAQVEESRA